MSLLPGLVWVWLAMLVEAAGQIFFKRGADTSHQGTHPTALLRNAWRNGWIVAGIGCFGSEAILWTLALRKLPVSVAFPAGSVCFVFVALLSRMVLRERVGLERWIGITCILLGVALIGASA